MDCKIHILYNHSRYYHHSVTLWEAGGCNTVRWIQTKPHIPAISTCHHCSGQFLNTSQKWIYSILLLWQTYRVLICCQLVVLSYIYLIYTQEFPGQLTAWFYFKKEYLYISLVWLEETFQVLVFWLSSVDITYISNICPWMPDNRNVSMRNIQWHFLLNL